MKKLNEIAFEILSNGRIFEHFNASDEYDSPVNAFEVGYEEEIFILIFDSNNSCTGIMVR